MQDNTVSIDTSTRPVTITYAPVFNVAVPFIDNHLTKGRRDKTVIRVAGGESVTYGKLAENVNKAGNGLLDLGITPGNRVLMMVKDSATFYYLFWGAIKAGIVPVPINTLLRAKDYRFMIEDSDCAAVVYSPEFAGEVVPALEAAAHKPTHTFPTEGEGHTLAHILAASPSELDAAKAAQDDDCFWLYSSGTTGTPKGAVHLHRDMVETSEHYGIQTLGVREDDICFSAAKLFFAYGLGNGMTFPLWAGATSVLLPGPPLPKTTLEIIENEKPTLFFGVPTLYTAQLKYLEENSCDFSSLRACISAGEALPADIFKRWKENTGTEILDGIGSTEALHIFISNVLGDIKPGTSGRIVPGYEAKIIDESQNIVATGESGRLLIKGGSTAKYYWNNPERTAQTMVDSWLDTGDTYIQDEDGYYHYCGRNDDMMKVGGIWCSPFEIEATLIAHPKVLEAAVIGHEDDAGLTKPKAIIVLNNPEDAGDDAIEELTTFCKNNMAKYKYPRWIDFVEELPKTATGKIQRFKLR